MAARFDLFGSRIAAPFSNVFATRTVGDDVRPYTISDISNSFPSAGESRTVATGEVNARGRPVRAEVRGEAYPQALQRSVPIIQVHFVAELLQEIWYTEFNTDPVVEYLYDLYQEALGRALRSVVYTRAFGNRPASGYCQIRIGTRGANHSFELNTHEINTEMSPLASIRDTIAEAVDKIGQSRELNVDLEQFMQPVDFTFTFVFIEADTNIVANTVTSAYRMHQRPRTQIQMEHPNQVVWGDRAEIRNLVRFTFQERAAERIDPTENIPFRNIRNQQEVQPVWATDVQEAATQLSNEQDPFVNAPVAIDQRRKRRTREEMDALGPNDPETIRRQRQAEYRKTSKYLGSVDQYKRNRNNPQLRGIYEEYRKRLFHHSSIEQYFKHTKAVLEVVNTHEEGHCIAMAFIRSQLRITYTADGHSEESEGRAYIANCESEGLHRGVPVIPKYRAMFNTKYSFVSDCNEEGLYETILLFNPYRQRKQDTELNGALRYENIVCDDEQANWYLAARNFHEFVEMTYRVVYKDPTIVLDPNEEGILQCYANVMQVAISLYRTDCQGERTGLYVPENWPYDLRDIECIPMVSLLSNSEHVHCITHIRDFVHGKTTANRTNVDSYCVVCQRIRSANNCTKLQACQHFKQCLDTKKGELKLKDRQAFKYQDLNEYVPPMCRYNFKDKDYKCRICRQSIAGDVKSQLEHVCEVQCMPNKVGRKEDVFVYDFECSQEFHAELKHYRHKVNLVCCRRAYSNCDEPEERTLFHTLEEFMHYVLGKTEERRIYLAHNGGRYDVQFIMRYLEKNMIYHDMVPTPNSMHAYLSVTVPFGKNKAAIFLDFRNFMPSSLRNIAISFQLPISKGDFPHRFNNGFHDQYVGSLPHINDANDFWCVQTKRTEEEVDEFHAFYQEQTEIYCTCLDICACSKLKWDFQEQIIKYCWQDVDVLAEAVVRYRDNALSFGDKSDESEEALLETDWVAQSIDPFEYLTIPQVAIHLLLNGRPEDEERQTCLSITQSKLRTDRSPKAVIWLERLMASDNSLRILHIGNSNREFYCFSTKRYLDGYDGRKVYICLDCEFHSCPDCYFEEMQTGQDHPTRPGTFSTIHRSTKDFLITLLGTYGNDNVVISWAHQVESLSLYEARLSNLMSERDMFYGGRTEVFSPYVNVDHFPDYELKYLDVCSLYPYVCAFKVLPTGNPVHIFGRHVETARLTDPNHPDPYFGYVRCHIIPNRKCFLGLLPKRDSKTGRLEFPLEPMEGSWGTDEIRLALERGYIITEIYEIYHFDSENRSDTLLRGYVSFFLRMKQESEGWKKLGASSDDPSDEEKLSIQEKVYQDNGYIGKVRISQVRKDPVRRQMAKIYLNSLWGKFCQKPNRTFYETIHSYTEFCRLWFDKKIDKHSFQFRHLGGDTWKVKYEVKQDYNEPNAKYNIYLASKVTEWARCILHRQMLRIGEQRICYCDTDSLIFLWPKSESSLTGCGLGKWVDEYPRDRIVQLYALAPKFYFLVFADGTTSLKSKGIQLTLENVKRLHKHSLASQLLQLYFPIYDAEGNKKPFDKYISMTNMLIGVNTVNSKEAYGQMLTRYTNEKRVRPVYMKRLFVPYLHQSNVDYSDEMISLIPRILTIPHGYYYPLETFSKHSYRDLHLNELPMSYEDEDETEA